MQGLTPDGETDLAVLIASMRPVRRDGEYVLVVQPHAEPAPSGALAMIDEAEGRTYVLRRADADALGWPYDFVAAWITLQVHSSLAAVGLTAAFSTELAQHGLSCNVLAGFYHDHLLVDLASVDLALETLTAMTSTSGAPR